MNGKLYLNYQIIDWIKFSHQRDESGPGKNDFHIGVFAYELCNAT